MGLKKVLIADDHVIIRHGLKYLINSTFNDLEVYETDSVKGINKLMQIHVFDYLILDMQMQDGNIIEIFSNIKSNYPRVRTLIYTMSAEDIFGKRMLQLGADGFISKLSSELETINALKLFFSNKRYISKRLAEQLSNEQLEKKITINPFEKLSDRELAVLNYLLKGDGVKTIAVNLKIKTNTVATFKARIFNKLGINNLIDLRNLTELYNFKPN